MSLNQGRSFSDACSTDFIKTFKIPTIKVDEFSPLNSHIQDQVYLDMTGEFFTDRDKKYTCLFSSQLNEINDDYEPVAITEVIILNNT